ncbi:RING/U-box [Glarea lozoyensis ATCC 20868]|uniref:RING/U-box n=1 Tax=Glarea lozoyensis (strain ATCC 20868 / MF5171) TaxID=1116229 RepID=S3DAQ4_GLAL2|nr:RING/U-box [Glarea lozoyensis ATCC 20868]EPE29066.1 RING/U-box [Glarea lozoyensis ATCC 20868]
MSQSYLVRFTCSHTEDYTVQRDGTCDWSISPDMPGAVDLYVGTLCRGCIGKESTYLPTSPPIPDHAQPFVPSELFNRIPLMFEALELYPFGENTRLSKTSLSYIKDVYRHLEMQMRWKRHDMPSFEKKRMQFVKSNIKGRPEDVDRQNKWEMEWKEFMERSLLKHLAWKIQVNALKNAHEDYLNSLPKESTSSCLSIPPLLTTPSSASIEEECHICQSPMDEESGEKPCQLPCSHIFGDKCIGTWLRDQSSCPLCRTVFERDAYSYPKEEIIQDSDVLAEGEEYDWVLVVRGVIPAEASFFF